ncbi:MAG: DUF4139 domain-containing protein [Polyangiaceae bacterium]|nr:DUF4139 domain-containing protein [Polyangiaceae bacterium]
MRLGSLVLTSLIALGCARGPNVSTDQLPLKRVVVYRNGVGYFERSGRVDADAVTFKMRQRMVGDFLASLAIVERGGSSVRSASFPLEIEKEEGEAEIDPRYQSMLKPWPGPPPKKKEANPLREVILQLDGKEHDLAIGYVSETPVWRPSYRLVVQEGDNADLQTWGIVQNLSGEDWKSVDLVLVAGAPLAFESTLGDPVIPQRPIVTDTGEVIAAVPTGVTSLGQRKEAELEKFGGEEAEAAPADKADEGGLGLRGAGRGGGGSGDSAGEDLDDEVDALKKGGKAERSRTKAKKPMAKRVASTGAMAPAAPPAEPAAAGPGRPKPSPDQRRRMALEEAKREGLSAPRRMSALAAVAVEAGATRYEIPTPITVPNESATMVLLLNKRVPGEAVFLFAPDGGVPESSSHPFRVARFTNATNGLLERGPIAVFEKGSFLGQGMLDSLPPKATAVVPFALERSLAVALDRKYDEQGARIFKIEAGELWIERDSVQKTLYTVSNGGDKPGKVLVKHPRGAGTRLFKPPAGTEDNAALGHALVPMSVKPFGKSELTVDERRAHQQQVSWLSPLADEAVKAFLSDSRANPQVQTQLKNVWAVREIWKKSVDEERKLTDEQAELEKASNETRLSLRAIEKNTQAADLRVKLTKRLDEVTKRMEQITKRLIEVKMAMNEQEVRFRDAVREIKLLVAPPPKE